MDKSICYWNVRGACGPNFLQSLRLACSKNHLSLIFLSKTKNKRMEKLKCVSKLGFNGMVCVPSLGRSDGLLAAWKSNFINVDIISQSKQLIHVQCGFPDGCVLYVTAIYALPDYRQKQILWDNMRQYASSMVDSWAVIGDFNDIVSSVERTGGMRVHEARCSLFSDRIR
ncbi:hypothetical protein K1719_032852 [Acacia pycnantha]|nr:hypothetical protein K1719_032852 [Acacia pycnantha]